jgi:hypothetical protein
VYRTCIGPRKDTWRPAEARVRLFRQAYQAFNREKRGGGIMAGKKTVSIVLIVAGIVILVLSLAADLVGLGGSNVVFGPQQIIGAVVGAIVTVVGLVLRLRK